MDLTVVRRHGGGTGARRIFPITSGGAPCSVLALLGFVSLLVGANAGANLRKREEGSPFESSDATCSSKLSPQFDGVVPLMPSVWWSNSLQNGSNVQIKSVHLKAWWKLTPKDHSPLVYTSNSSEATVFAVLRTGANGIRLVAKDFYIVTDGVKLVSKRLVNSHLTVPSSVFDVLPVKNDERRKVGFRFGHNKFVKIGSKIEEGVHLIDSMASSDVFEVREITRVPSIRGVNVGNWLVMEAWMRPDPFVRVSFINDGLKFNLQSVYNGKFCGMESTQSPRIVCNQEKLDESDVFHLRKLGGDLHQIRTADNRFWRLSPESGGTILVDHTSPHVHMEDKAFQISFNPDDAAELMIKASNGQFLEVDRTGNLTATASPSTTSPGRGSPSWIRSSSFHSVHSSAIRGEWQISNSLPDAKDVIELHRATWLTEDDFSIMEKNGINAIRIPIGYWIVEHLADGEPFVGGGVAHLDRAFELASKYGIRIFLSMHGAPGSQNGYEHSGSRDGLADFGMNSTNVDRHLEAIRWIVDRYSKHASFLGIGLLNQPTTQGVSLSILKQFYLDAYKLIRRMSPCLFISIQPRVDADYHELDDFMADDSYTNVITELHFYHLFDTSFHKKSSQHFLDHVRFVRSQEIDQIQNNGRMMLVGEWSLGLPEYANPTDSEIQSFALVQLETYAKAEAGWFFWSHKIGRLGWSVWSFSESFDNGWLKREANGKSFF